MAHCKLESAVIVFGETSAPSDLPDKRLKKFIPVVLKVSLTLKKNNKLHSNKQTKNPNILQIIKMESVIIAILEPIKRNDF